MKFNGISPRMVIRPSCCTSQETPGKIFDKLIITLVLAKEKHAELSLHTHWVEKLISLQMELAQSVLD